MSLEIITGTIDALTPAKDKQPGTCRIDGRNIVLHRDLADRVDTGDTVIIGGQESKEGIKALAINNRSQQRTSAIDSSNLVLAMGMSGFVSLVFFIFGMQYLAANIINLAVTNLLLVLIGLTGINITLGRILAIRKAIKLIRQP